MTEGFIMNMDNKNSGGKPLLLVWITNPSAAGRIVAQAKQFADRNAMGLLTVSVQQQTRDRWSDTIKDLEQLNLAARSASSQLTVIYSDDSLDAAEKLILDICPAAMFAGVSPVLPDGSCANRFLEVINSDFPEIPLYCVNNDGQVSEYER